MAWTFCERKDWIYRVKSMAKYFILENFVFLSKLQKILWIYSWATLQSTLSTLRGHYILRKPPYSAQIQENSDQKNLRIWTLFTQWQLWRVLETRCKVTGQLRKALEKTWVLREEKELPCCFFISTKFNGAQIWKLYLKSTK